MNPNRQILIASIVKNHKRNRLSSESSLLDLPEVDDRAPSDYLLRHQREIAQIEAERESEMAESFDGLFGAYEG